MKLNKPLKLRRRQRSLALTTSLTEVAKQEIKQGLIPECMSPEESVTESEAESDENSEGEQETTTKKKKIVVRPLSWRSQRFNEYIASLDRKANRRKSSKATTMTRPGVEGDALLCDPPEGIQNCMKI